MGRIPIILIALVATTFASPQRSTVNNTWLVTMKDGTADILKSMSTIPKNSMHRADRIQTLVQSLQDHATTSQQDIVNFLNQEIAARAEGQLSFQVLWIANQIVVRGADTQLITKLQERADVAKVVKDYSFHLDHPLETSPQVVSSRAAGDITSWGVDKVKAPQVWAQGFNGSGIIVATIDSGAQGDHEALQGSFVGADNFGWFDPIESELNPFDDLGHGTHTMGTIVGHFSDASGETKIGVAPGATWMACKGCTGDNYCWASDVNACFQFLLCPKGQNSSQCDASKAPHVINNSYFIDYIKGSSAQATRDDVIEASLDALDAAGIVMVFSIGNAYYCESAGYPGDYEKVIGVGSTTSSDDLSSFSSSGPGTTHGSSVIKPEVVAPGSNIMSAVVGNGHQYGSKSGTSMAGPHVAGVVALMLSKNPNLDVKQVREILFDTCETMEMSETKNCGGVPDTTFPNFSLGYGKVNALTAVNLVPQP
jgi:serine protease AprX